MPIPCRRRPIGRVGHWIYGDDKERDRLSVSEPIRLPHFERPPVSQVTLGVQFDPIARLRAAHLGLFWENLHQGSRYPRIDEYEARKPRLEFPSDQGGAALDLSVGHRVRVPRVVFSSEGRRDQVVIQNDLLLTRWERQQDPYPRFEHPRDRFTHAWQQWKAFVAELKLGDIRLAQAEVTYTNEFVPGEGWSTVTELSNLVRIQPPPRSLGTLETYHYLDTTIIQAPQGPARLRVALFSNESRANDGPATLELSFRGSLASDATDQHLMEFFELGHSAIVDTFVDITTPTAHQMWGRRHK